ncbi:MAG: Hpt domain-containing protein [Bacteroidia bacterium]
MNIAELKDYLNCDNNFLEGIIEKFIEESRAITAVITESSKAENWEAVRLNAHKMLSSVKIFEINELIGLLEKLEKESGNESKRPELKEEIKNLGVLVEKSIHDLQEGFAELN